MRHLGRETKGTARFPIGVLIHCSRPFSLGVVSLAEAVLAENCYCYFESGKIAKGIYEDMENTQLCFVDLSSVIKGASRDQPQYKDASVCMWSLDMLPNAQKVHDAIVQSGHSDVHVVVQ